ncbi:46010_t:CDS:2, partial [Gigaspora margarita]
MEMYIPIGLTTTSSPQYQSTYVALANNSIVVVENQFGTESDDALDKNLWALII